MGDIVGRSGLFILIVIVLLAIVGYFYFSSQNEGTPLASQTSAQPAGTASSAAENPQYGIPAGEETATGTASTK
jgi:flagellar basal body-associated protein FliL